MESTSGIAEVKAYCNEDFEQDRYESALQTYLDVVMEGVDGYKVCKQIKSQHDVHIAMLTSKKSPFDKVRGTMSGCDAYVTKPPTDQRLKEEIEKSIHHRAKKIDRLTIANAR